MMVLGDWFKCLFIFGAYTPRGYDEPAIPQQLALPIVLIVVAFIGFIVVKALVDIEPEFGNIGWGIYGTTISAIILFIIGYLLLLLYLFLDN